MLSVTDNFCYRQLPTKVPKVAGASVEKISIDVNTTGKVPMANNVIRALNSGTVEECRVSRMTEGQMYRIKPRRA